MSETQPKHALEDLLKDDRDISAIMRAIGYVQSNGQIPQSEAQIEPEAYPVEGEHDQS